ncbi:hypothetical protein J9A58_26260, partial [Klebsiella pneumoniae]
FNLLLDFNFFFFFFFAGEGVVVVKVIVIAYLSGYSFDQTFLKCAETLPDAHSMNIQTLETIRNCS